MVPVESFFNLKCIHSISGRFRTDLLALEHSSRTRSGLWNSCLRVRPLTPCQCFWTFGRPSGKSSSCLRAQHVIMFGLRCQAYQPFGTSRRYQNWADGFLGTKVVKRTSVSGPVSSWFWRISMKGRAWIQTMRIKRDFCSLWPERPEQRTLPMAPWGNSLARWKKS